MKKENAIYQIEGAVMFLSMAILVLFLVDEPYNFSNISPIELFLLLFFPVGIVAGLFLAYHELSLVRSWQLKSGNLKGVPNKVFSLGRFL